MKYTYLRLLFLYFTFVAATKINDTLIHLPNYGDVQGATKVTVNGNKYSAFEGIPYAQAPVNNLRFQDPKPALPWMGTFQAHTPTICMQYYHYANPEDELKIRGEEDCLHLNVYVPKSAQNGTVLRDVIVFIHGGAFMFGSGKAYAEKHLMDHNIVYVTFNYRLGPLGFLSTEDSIVPGNMGLKDQKMALIWVKNNIRHFGGNPDRILLAGMSAGGASVHLHILTSKGQNLFHSALIQSGVALNVWVLTENSREKALKVGKLLGCYNHHNVTDVVECLKSRPAKQIVAAVKYFQPWLYNPFTPFGAVIDSHSDSPFLDKHPIEIYKNCIEENNENLDIVEVPTIFSHVESEGIYPSGEFFSKEKYMHELNVNFGELIPHILDFNNTLCPEKLKEVGNKIRKYYFGDRRINKDMFRQFIKMASDRIFKTDIKLSTALHAKCSKSAVYSYKFSYRGTNSKSESMVKDKDDYGASHGDDTIYVLSTKLNVTSTGADRKMSQILQNLWLDFAHTGEPKLGNLGAKWAQVERNMTSKLEYVHIKSPEETVIEEEPFLGDTEAFWSNLGLEDNYYKDFFTARSFDSNNLKIEL